MPRIINPRTLAPPAAGYAYGVVHSARARRLVAAGIVGLRPDGTLPAEVSDQMDQAFDNLEAVLQEAGMGVGELIRVKVLCTVPGAGATFRTLREKRLGRQRITASYVEVAGLAAPEYLVELEAEALCEEGELAFLDYEAGATLGAGGPGGQMAGPPAKE